ncbi:MAG: hypothetical protein RIC29_03250 [Rhodospirillaceae bacterium]
MSATVVYDLRVLAPTFDFIGFMSMVYGLLVLNSVEPKEIEVIIVCGKSLRGAEFNATESQEERILQRLYDVILPLTRLLPYIKSTNVIDARSKSLHVQMRDIFYPNPYSATQPELYKYYKNHMLYSVAKRTDVRVIQCPTESLNVAKGILKRHVGVENPVVITIRNNFLSHDRSRDNLQKHLSIAEKLSEDFPVVLIPDTSDLETPMPTTLPVVYEAALDVVIRAAVYQVAHANICGPTGPGSLMSLNKDVTYLHAEYATGEYYTEEWFRREGFVPGSNLFSENNPKQQIDFGPLTYERAKNFVSSQLN